MAGSGVTRTLFIGVGGSGGTTLRYLYKELENGLLARGWQGPMPECWQFLSIDVTSSPDGIRGDVPNVLTEAEHYLGLSRRGVEWSTYLNMLTDDDAGALAGWLPQLPIPGQPELGAAQMRSLGHLVSMTTLAQIQNRIDLSIRKLDASTEDLLKVGECLGAKISQEKLETGKVRIYVVTSLGGGSGSGVFLDISLVLQARNYPHVNIMYTPDVFDNLTSQGGNPGVVPNTLAAISELMSAFEGFGKSSDGDTRLLGRAGLVLPPTNHRTSNANLIIGRQGDGYILEDQSQVYHTTARALSAMFLSPEIAEQVENYVFQNDDYIETDEKFSALKSSDDETRSARTELARSIGVASVSTGRSAFGQYTAERLTSFLIQRFEDDEKALKVLKESKNDEFGSQVRAFASQCGLAMPTADSNQVLVAITGANISLVQTAVTKIKTKVAEHLRDALNKQQYGPSAVSDAVSNDFRSIFASDSPEFDQSFASAVGAWVETSQKQLVDATITSIANNGLLVTLEYLMMLQSHMQQGAVDLRAQIGGWRSEADQYVQRAKSVFDGLEKRVKLAFDSTPVRESINGYAESSLRRLREKVANQVAGLIDDFVDGVLKPLHAELSHFRSEMINQVSASEELASRINSLAKDEVPVHLLPSRNEIFLDKTDTFKATFAEKLSMLFSNLPPDDALKKASAEVLRKVWDGRDVAQFPLSQYFLSTKSKWRPRAIIAATSEMPSKATFSAGRFSMDDILETSRQWQRTRNEIHQYTGIPLYDYLYPKNEASRTAEFILAYKQALTMSGVMAEIDSVALQAYSAKKEILRPEMARIYSSIPIKRSDTAERLTPEAEAISSAIQQEEGGRKSDKDAEQLIVGSTIQTSVQIFTVLKERTPIPAFASLTKPINERWSKVLADPQSRKKFFTLRRSRVLPWFIPVSDEVVVRMIKGWTIARVLGLISPRDIEEFCDSRGFHEIKIFDTRSEEFGFAPTFPCAIHGSSDMTDESQVLPILLESMILGYMAVGKGHLNAYSRLADLGMDLSHLKRWIRSGEIEDSAKSPFPVVPPDTAWANLATPVERRAKFHEYLDQREKSHREVLEQEFTLLAIGKASLKWELRHQIAEALTALRNDLGRIEDDAQKIPE